MRRVLSVFEEFEDFEDCEDFEDFEKTCFDPFDQSSACGFLSSQDRHNMYQIFFLRSIKVDEETGAKNISDEAQGQLKVLRGMLGLSEEDTRFGGKQRECGLHVDTLAGL